MKRVEVEKEGYFHVMIRDTHSKTNILKNQYDGTTLSSIRRKNMRSNG
jgi:hypothetical protein